jgi:ERCC4-type nuclease
VRAGDRLLAAVERKTLEDYIKSLVVGSLAFALAELAALPSARRRRGPLLAR